MDQQSVEFYRALSGHYDLFFPVEPATVEFLLSRVAAASPNDDGSRPAALDLACGTGLYTDALANCGIDTRGVDGSADLIQIGQRRSPSPERLSVMDMRDLSRLATGSFDIVFCIGNSLSHLANQAEVLRVVASAVDLLRSESGQLVLQYVDMSDVPVGGVRDLPTLSAGALEFERCYERKSEATSVFNARLVDTETGQITGISNRLTVIDTPGLFVLLEEKGLEEVDVRGGFRGEPPAGSWVRVVTASLRRTL